MFFLHDLSTYRKFGSKDKKPRLKKIRKSIFNSNTAGSAATGSGLGWAIGRAATKNYGGERYGILSGLAAGTALGIHHSYKKLNNK